MENHIQFIADLNDFFQILLVTIDSKIHNQILISGTFEHPLFKRILDRLLKTNNIKNSKVLIPYVSSSGTLSRNYINKISGSGGEIRMNSTFKKNLIVIDKEVFIISLSSKYTKDIIKSNFECAVQTNDKKTVNYICEIFEKIWIKSLLIDSF